MAVAQTIALLSHCSRKHVGAVATDLDHEQIWVGYNGGPRGGRNRCARETPGDCGCVHAEVNALVKADARIPKRMYLTLSPCEQCAVLMLNSRVQEVVYVEQYRDVRGLVLLAEAGVHISRSVPPVKGI